MKTIRLVKSVIMSALAAAAFGSGAQACGISGGAPTATKVYYDPFSPSGLANTTVRMTLTRQNPSGADRTNTVDFYLRAQSSAANGTSVVPTAVVGQAGSTGLNNNIFVNFSAPAPVFTQPSSSTNGYLHVDFTGNNAGSDTIQVDVTVTFPANLDLQATTGSIAFDINYVCTGQKSNGSGVNPGAMVFPIEVLSALQASYVGTALDFGEVGNKTTAQLTPTSAYTKTGNIRVASSGAYNVTMTSTNNYRLSFNGQTGAALAPQSLTYSATLLGITRTGTSGGPVAGQTAITKTCAAAGISGRLLPLSVVLTEGGQGKMVSPSYSDTLNITIAPQVASVVGSPCP